MRENPDPPAITAVNLWNQRVIPEKEEESLFWHQNSLSFDVLFC